jgi:hypothetical protein
MNNKIILWIAAVVIAFLTAFLHQRTSPYYPVSGSFGIEGERLTYLLQKIHYGNEPFEILIRTDVNDLKGSVQWKRKEDADWNYIPLKKEGKFLKAEIQPQEPGTEIVYKGSVNYKEKTYEIPNRRSVNVVFAGKRPSSVMNVFYFFLYGGLLISIRGALDYFNPHDKRMLFSLLATIFFFISSIIFYPFLRSYELGVINKSIPPINLLFDIPLIMIFVLWFVSTLIILKYKTKVVLLITGTLTVIIFQFIYFY